MREMTVEQAARQMAARRLAGVDGKKWAELPREQRKQYVVSGRGNVQDIDRRKALQLLAKKEAKRTGKTWADLPKEQRRVLLTKIRGRQGANE
jgi:hypothetical protein